MILNKPGRNEISHTAITMAAERVQEHVHGAMAALRDACIKAAKTRVVPGVLTTDRPVEEINSEPVTTEQQQTTAVEARHESRRALGAPIRSQFFLSDWRWPLMKWAIPIATLWCLSEVWTGTNGPRTLIISLFGLVLVAGWIAAVKARTANPSLALAIVDYLYVAGALVLLVALWALLLNHQWDAAQTLTRDLLIWAPLIAGFASFTYARTPGVAVGFTVATYATLIAAVLVLSNVIGAAWQHLSVYSLLAQGAATLLAGVFFSRFRDSVSLTIAKLRIAEGHSFQDTLTGLANRRKFDADWQVQQECGGLSSLELSLVLLDIDHFKTINDRFGHAVGDQVLTEMARRIGLATQGVAKAYRWGGEEFAVIVPGTGLQARRIARSIVDAAAGLPFESVGRVTISAGVASRRCSETAEVVFQRADSALLSAKAQGRNRVCWAPRTDKTIAGFPVVSGNESLYANRPSNPPSAVRIRLCHAA